MEKNSIRVHESVHSMGVQRSNYLQVDNELMADLHHNPHKVRAMTRSMKPKVKDRSGRVIDPNEHIFNQVYLKYCKPMDVRAKHQVFVNFKAKFLVQLIALKSKGVMLEMNEKVKDWIDENLD